MNEECRENVWLPVLQLQTKQPTELIWSWQGHCSFAKIKKKIIYQKQKKKTFSKLRLIPSSTIRYEKEFEKKVRTEYSKQTGIPINPVCIGFPIGIFPYILFPDPRQSFPALFTDMGLMACMEFSRRWGKNLLTSISMPLPTAVKTK